MAVMVIQHKVRDYDAWRRAYDAHQGSPTGAGVTNGRIYRKAEDPSDILGLFDVADVAKARAWTEGADLRAAMEKGGVVSSRLSTASDDRSLPAAASLEAEPAAIRIPQATTL